MEVSGICSLLYLGNSHLNTPLVNAQLTHTPGIWNIQTRHHVEVAGSAMDTENGVAMFVVALHKLRETT